MLEFKNPELNKSFKMNGEKDSLIQVPHYRGQLSDVKDAKVLEGMIKRGSKLVSRLDASTKPASTAPAGNPGAGATK